MINIGGGAMPKVRIYELAKMLKIENKELIEKLKELGMAKHYYENNLHSKRVELLLALTMKLIYLEVT